MGPFNVEVERRGDCKQRVCGNVACEREIFSGTRRLARAVWSINLLAPGQVVP